MSNSVDNINLLDKGFVRLINHMGDDLTVVNAARCSYGVSKEQLDPTDEKLIKYLAKHQHFSPFRHSFITVHVKAPLFVHAQVVKHRVGVEINSLSGRYREAEEGAFYVPDAFRLQATVNKQSSEGALSSEDNLQVQEVYRNGCEASLTLYKTLLDAGVCREQARAVLPQGMYTEFYMTMSLQALAHFIKLRDDPHAQWEIQEYARALKQLGMRLFPRTLGALLADPA